MILFIIHTFWTIFIRFEAFNRYVRAKQTTLRVCILKHLLKQWLDSVSLSHSGRQGQNAFCSARYTISPFANLNIRQSKVRQWRKRYDEKNWNKEKPYHIIYVHLFWSIHYHITLLFMEHKKEENCNNKFEIELFTSPAPAHFNAFAYKHQHMNGHPHAHTFPAQSMK